MTNDKQRERLVELFENLEDPSSTCPRFGTNKVCEGCKYLKGDDCDLTGRFVDYLLANGVMVLPYKPFPVLLSEDENNSDVYCPFCNTDLSGHYYGGDYEAPKIVPCFECGTWLDGTKAITKEEAEKALGGVQG